MNRHPSAALIATSQVVRQPCDVTGKAGVDRTRNNEDARVHDAGFLRWICRDTHGKADDHDAQEADDEGASFAKTVGEVGEDDGEDGGSDIDRDGEELGGG